MALDGGCASVPPSELRADHSRGPGSFCALNPEGCSPPPASTPGTFDLDSCFKACDAGGAALESYCRSLAETWQRQLCWSVVQGSKAACKGMCSRINACVSYSTACPPDEG
ncbi:hypothetical protein [Corallococcus sp. RDP092CA]|uniref:hypothetical protein n=1 Tax=Corallococcus sp. RDP092CA TaxID=3109369 RepID=UPI0035B268E7